MSVVPTWRDLPSYRIPRRLRALVPDAAGKDEDVIWRLGEGPFAPGAITAELSLRPDRTTHGLIEPAGAMTLDQYRAALAATRDSWQIDED